MEVHSGEKDKCMGYIRGYSRIFVKCTAGRYVLLAPSGHTRLLAKVLAAVPGS